MSTARRRLKSPQSLSGTSPQPHHGHTSQYHGHKRMTHTFRSMSIGQTIPEIKLFQTLTLKFQLQGQGHGCGQRARSYNRPSIILTHFIFISHQSDQHFWELFRNLTLKHPRSRSWVRSKVKVTYCTQHPTDALPFRFTSIGPTIPEIWPKVCLTLKKHIRIFK